MSPNRPEPAIGELLVADLMTPNPYTASQDSNLDDVSELMRIRRIRHVPIVDEDDRLVGLVSHRDLLGRAFGGGQDLPRSIRQPYLRSIPVTEVMTRTVISASPERRAADIACQMLNDRLGCLPVVQDDRVVGIVTASDFVRFVAGCA
jgi:CBS domain-containing membrane protein